MIYGGELEAMLVRRGIQIKFLSPNTRLITGRFPLRSEEKNMFVEEKLKRKDPENRMFLLPM